MTNMQFTTINYIAVAVNTTKTSLYCGLILKPPTLDPSSVRENKNRTFGWFLRFLRIKTNLKLP